jgi:hypothetical protein
MSTLISFYQTLGFNSFYRIISDNANSNSKEFIQNHRFLSGIASEKIENSNLIVCSQGDIRIDVPVWFGDAHSAEHRIMVFGLEPRDTHPLFNIERVGNRVFAAPFGIDRWNDSSSVERKPQNKYFRVFKNLIEKPDSFILFSDIVKEYEIVSEENEKGANDQHARNTFFERAEKSLPFLTEEINLINPTHLITMGNEAHTFLSQHFSNKNVIRLRHPSNGGESLAKEQIDMLFF